MTGSIAQEINLELVTNTALVTDFLDPINDQIRDSLGFD